MFSPWCDTRHCAHVSSISARHSFASSHLGGLLKFSLTDSQKTLTGSRSRDAVRAEITSQLLEGLVDDGTGLEISLSVSICLFSRSIDDTGFREKKRRYFQQPFPSKEDNDDGPCQQVCRLEPEDNQLEILGSCRTVSLIVVGTHAHVFSLFFKDITERQAE